MTNKQTRQMLMVAWATAVALGGAPALAQPSPAAAAAAAGGTSTSANGGTGGVGLGGAGPGVAPQADSPLGAGTSTMGRAPGSDALVGPRARRDAAEALADKKIDPERPPLNSGQRALLLDQERRATRPAAP